MTNELNESAFATVDATGRATATIQPLRAFEEWRVRKMTVQNNSTVLVPTCRVYRGSEAASNLEDGTFTGTMDSSETDITLRSGERLIAVWEGVDVGSAGADVGSRCTFSVRGDISRGV